MPLPAATPAEHAEAPAGTVSPAPAASGPDAAARAGAPRRGESAVGRHPRRKRAKADPAAGKQQPNHVDDASPGTTHDNAAHPPTDSTVLAPDSASSGLLAGPAPSIFSAAAGVRVPGFFIASFRIPPFLLPVYQAAGARYGVPWEVLAAINEIETDYGRNARTSSAGAVGWMQFLPSTWKQYGVDANRDGVADPGNPIDAVFAAARYLRAAGANGDLRGAIFAYNHAEWYVDSVLERARLIGGMPDGLVTTLTGIAEARFPVAARATYQRGGTGSLMFARAGAAVVAVNDGRIVSVGRTKRLGRFIRLEDVYGNTYTYARLKRTGQRPKAARTGKLRLYAYRANGIRFKELRPGTHVVAGTILGRIGRTGSHGRPHVLFQIRPAGRGTPRIDPQPILDGWRLLRAAGELPMHRKPALRQSGRALAARVLTDPRVRVYDCGRRDIRAGQIDRRVLAALEFLAASGLHPTVSSLKCGHGVMTSSGNVSEHSTGSAVDISALNGIPIAGHQGPSSITELAVRRLLTLDEAMKPHQIISLMHFDGASNVFAMADHADHLHIGWRAIGDSARDLDRAEMTPRQWISLVDRLRRMERPKVDGAD
jgi:soluble lytic murein transglycosylase-like protein